jgi:hypothetical protein
VQSNNTLTPQGIVLVESDYDEFRLQGVEHQEKNPKNRINFHLSKNLK